MKMRIPTNEEWNKFMDIVCEDNSRSHWKGMFSWISDSDFPAYRAFRGCYSTRCQDWRYASHRDVHLGFRPAIDILETEARVSSFRDGDTVIIGTLYMRSNPVKVPQTPTYDGDIADYILGAKLEMREALVDPAYQVPAIKVGNVLIADRCLVRNISYSDIQAACIGEPEVPMAVKIRVQEIANVSHPTNKFGGLKKP